jgi:hypothetical protein
VKSALLQKPRHCGLDPQSLEAIGENPSIMQTRRHRRGNTLSGKYAFVGKKHCSLKYYQYFCCVKITSRRIPTTLNGGFFVNKYA